MPKIKNIIIFLTIGAIMVLVYIFFIKKPPEDTATLVSSSPDFEVSGVSDISQTPGDNSLITQEFLNLLLNIRNIKLDDAIFSDPAFTSLDGSHSITLTPDGTEGRINPFAPIGTDIVIPPANPSTTIPASTTGV